MSSGSFLWLPSRTMKHPASKPSPLTSLVFVVVTLQGFYGNQSTTTVATNTTEIRLGLVQPFSGPLGFEQTAAATTMALADAQAAGYLEGFDVRYSKLLKRIYVVTLQTRRVLQVVRTVNAAFGFFAYASGNGFAIKKIIQKIFKAHNVRIKPQLFY